MRAEKKPLTRPAAPWSSCFPPEGGAFFSCGQFVFLLDSRRGGSRKAAMPPFTVPLSSLLQRIESTAPVFDSRLLSADYFTRGTRKSSLPLPLSAVQNGKKRKELLPSALRVFLSGRSPPRRRVAFGVQRFTAAYGPSPLPGALTFRCGPCGAAPPLRPARRTEPASGSAPCSQDGRPSWADRSRPAHPRRPSAARALPSLPA